MLRTRRDLLKPMKLEVAWWLSASERAFVITPVAVFVAEQSLANEGYYRIARLSGHDQLADERGWDRHNGEEDDTAVAWFSTHWGIEVDACIWHPLETLPSLLSAEE